MSVPTKTLSKVLIIGGGITSAVSSSLLAKKCSKIAKISVWDKARGAGGRMSTSRSPGNPQCTADLGAQYISSKPEYNECHKDIYAELISNGLLQELQGEIKNSEFHYNDEHHYVATNGSASIVKHFFNKSQTEVNFNHHVNNINITNDKMLEVSTQDGKSEIFDAVVMTMPVPQILQLPGMEEIIDSKLKEKLSNVNYGSRYALGLFFDKSDPNVGFNDGGSIMNTSVEYITDDPIFCYAAIDGKKKGIQSPTSVMFHCRIPWSLKHIETPVKEIEDILVKHYKKLYPDWPEPTSLKCQKWRYSQVYTPFEGCPKAVVLNKSPLIVAGGDAFVAKYATVDDCISSSFEITKIVQSNIHKD